MKKENKQNIVRINRRPSINPVECEGVEQREAQNPITELAALINEVDKLHAGENEALMTRLEEELDSFVEEHGTIEATVDELIQIAVEERMLAKCLLNDPDGFTDVFQTVDDRLAAAADIMQHVIACLDIIAALSERV